MYSGQHVYTVDEKRRISCPYNITFVHDLRTEWLGELTFPFVKIYPTGIAETKPRIMLPSGFAQKGDSVMLLGNGEHLEVWNAIDYGVMSQLLEPGYLQLLKKAQEQIASSSFESMLGQKDRYLHGPAKERQEFYITLQFMLNRVSPEQKDTLVALIEETRHPAKA
ncbi:MAG: hypothetical protein HGA85_06315 [Nanoarchaeota archaeon]|nr:hypothetical protein [Nanoarchaeota archaeon]